jgi:hypothetical protein
MNKFILQRVLLVALGLFLIFYVGLYYCGWDAIIDLIDYAACDWDCVERYEIAWGLFRAFILLEIFLLLGILLIMFGMDKS